MTSTKTPVKTSRKQAGLRDAVEAPGFGRGAGSYGFVTAREKNKTTALDDLVKHEKFSGRYDPVVDTTSNHRPGSLDAFKLPSRMGDTLHHPDGRTKINRIKPQPKTIFLAD